MKYTWEKTQALPSPMPLPGNSTALSHANSSKNFPGGTIRGRQAHPPQCHPVFRSPDPPPRFPLHLPLQEDRCITIGSKVICDSTTFDVPRKSLPTAPSRS